MSFVKILDKISRFVSVIEKFCNKNLFLDLFSVVLIDFPDFSCLHNVYSGSIIEFIAFG